MAQTVTLTAETRTQFGTGAARRLRRAGKAPAVLYGHGEATTHLAVDAESAYKLLAARSHMVELQIDGAVQTALIQDADFDLGAERLTHVDFLRVRADEPVEVEVEIKLVGSSKGEKAGGSVDFALHALEVRSLPGNIPNMLELDVSGLEIGDVVHAKDVPLPPGVELLTDPDAGVLAIHHAAGTEAAAPAEGEAAAEPELIKPERAGDEEEAAD